MILFRVDASLQIGSGHVMRCLTLAHEFHKRGYNCKFACRSHQGNLIDFIRTMFPCCILEGKEKTFTGDYSEYAHWLGVSQIQDASDLISFIESQDEVIELLVVDHYAINREWELKVKRAVNKIFVIDDLANRSHYCDFLLDQNYYLNNARYERLVEKTTRLFLGPEYALLRDEFLKSRETIARDRFSFKKVLIFFGGIDIFNLSSLSLKTLLDSTERNFEIDMVTGGANPHLKNLRENANLNHNVNLHIQVNYMAELMAKADVCIGAGGSTNWERLCLGLPSIVISIADNQIETCRDLHLSGLINYLGHHDTITPTGILTGLKFMEDKIKDNYYYKLIMEIVDGKGVERVVNQVMVA